MSVFKKLPAVGKKVTEYSAVTGFILGALLGLLAGGYGIIFFLTAAVGLLVSHSKLSIHGFNTVYTITNLAFLLGVILFTRVASGLTIIIVYGLALLLGRFVKRRL
ncbi:MAG: hypothetical protein ACLFTH_02365 [Candidatus Woesearchaeota archaeon]